MYMQYFHVTFMSHSVLHMVVMFISYTYIYNVFVFIFSTVI